MATLVPVVFSFSVNFVIDMYLLSDVSASNANVKRAGCDFVTSEWTKDVIPQKKTIVMFYSD